MFILSHSKLRWCQNLKRIAFAMFKKQTRSWNFMTIFAEESNGTPYFLFQMVVISSHSRVAFSFPINAVIIMNLLIKEKKNRTLNWIWFGAVHMCINSGGFIIIIIAIYTCIMIMHETFWQPQQLWTCCVVGMYV